MSDDYIYAVSRVRSKEQTLLTGSVMESLLAANDYSECLRLLSDHGWNTDNAKENPGAMLKEERDKTWSFISEVVPDRHAFDVFRIANDYHNLKAAIKNTLAKLNEGIYMDKDMCTIDPALIQKAVSDRNFTEFPGEMEKVAEEALNTLLHTGDGQMCDIIIDKAALEGIYKAGKDSGNEILMKYAELTVASADIKTAIRAAKTGKDQGFLLKALAECDSLDAKSLAKAAGSGIDQVYEYLERTDYAGSVEEIRKSPSAFERWCDNTMIESIRPEIHHPFTIGPVAAFIIARENEIKSVRIVLSGKQNKLSTDSLRERVREMYV